MKATLVISLCLSLALPAFARSTRSGRAAAEVMMLSTACEAFRLEYGVYPPEETWLSELQATSNAVVNTRNKLFVDLSHPGDAWGNDFVYKLPGKHNPESFDLYSMGADETTKSDGDDPDDIASWHDPERWWRHYNPPLITPFRIILVLAIGAGIPMMVAVVKRREPNQLLHRTQ